MYAYETLILLRKLAIACFFVFLDTTSIQDGIQVNAGSVGLFTLASFSFVSLTQKTSNLQSLCALAIIGIAIVMHLILRPFESKRLDGLEQLSLYTIFITLFLCLFFTYPNVSMGMEESAYIKERAWSSNLLCPYCNPVRVQPLKQ